MSDGEETQQTEQSRTVTSKHMNIHVLIFSPPPPPPPPSLSLSLQLTLYQVLSSGLMLEVAMVS